uniref:ATP-dependent RNA helicase n=1 Tax=Kalanchoe fedtschenkoi TaxID=63787 RepID=A0A7N0UIE0_KALFE
MRFRKPSAILAVSLPMILTPPHKDLLAQAYIGSGKSTCIVLGMLCRVDPSQKVPQALCVCPTRELVLQNLEVLRQIGKLTGITSECVVPKDGESASKRPIVMSQVVFGIPGMTNSMICAKELDVNYLRIFVFDDADYMLADDEFKIDSLQIMKAIRGSDNRCQVLI